MTKTIEHLTKMMAGIHKTYYETEGQSGEVFGDVGQLRVHSENAEQKSISIDLYNFEGDGKPVCDGLTWCGVCPKCGETTMLRAFCICYSPKWEKPLCILCYEDEGECDDWEADPDILPASVVQSITNWIEGKLKEKKQEKKPEEDSEEDFVTHCQEIISAMRGDRRMQQKHPHYKSQYKQLKKLFSMG